MSRPNCLPRLIAAVAFALLLAVLQTARAANLPPEAGEIRASLRAHRLDDAVAKAESWTKANPQDAAAWTWSGRAYAQQAMSASIFSKPGWASKMQHAYERAVELDGTNLDTRFELMQFYAMAPGFMGGGSDKASAQAAAIAKLDPARGHVALGVIAESDDPKAAEREYRAAIAAAPDDPRGRVALSNLLSGQKRWGEARALFIELLERKPGDAGALYQLGKLAALSGEELEAGLASMDRYLAQQERPDDLPEFGGHWRRAQILERLGRKDAALAELRTATELDPSAEGPRKDLKRLGG
jgi:tetratricopeptide (TPR) repeat protein